MKDTSEQLMQEPIINMYTRKQAIEDGILIDVSSTARDAGIVYPVAITHNLWHSYIDKFDNAKSRLWEVLWIFRLKILSQDTNSISFNVSFSMPNKEPELVELMAICGPGDDLEPVITIMLPDDY